MEPGWTVEPVWTGRGTRAYRQIVIALFLCGFSSFSLLYCVQPLLPLLSRDFALDAASSALALSVSTGALAPSILFAGAISEAIGRKPLMAASLVGGSLLGLLAAVSPNWEVLLILRTLEGLALGGAPAIAMTYLAEEIHPSGLGTAMGLYVGGTAIGGMAGRLLTGLVAEFAGWRGAMAAIGVLGAVSAVAFLLLLPASRNFRKRPGFDPRLHIDAWLGHLRTPGLPAMFVTGALLMGSFVSAFNAASYRLLAPPYRLGQAELGSIFTIYLLGSAGSTAAGRLIDRLGARPVLTGGLLLSLAGLLLTLGRPLGLVVTGLALITVGFFAGHAAASGGVGRLARGAKAHAASLYLLCYYLGSSLLSLLSGRIWEASGWNGVAGFCAGLLLLALLLTLGGRPLLGRRRARTGAQRPGITLLSLATGLAACGTAAARDMPSAFLQQMSRAEAASPAPAPPGLSVSTALEVAGEPLRLGATPIAGLARRLGTGIEHQGGAADSVAWFCVRLDVLPGTKRPPRAGALSLWLLSEADQPGGSAQAVTALALDSETSESAHCPAPSGEAELRLDRHIAHPGAGAAQVAALYGQPQRRYGRISVSLPAADPDGQPLVLTLSMRAGRVVAIWLAAAADN